MSTTQLKEMLSKTIEDADFKLLHMLHALAEAYNSADDGELSDEKMVYGYELNGKAKTVEEMKASLAQQVNEAKAGKYITSSEFKKQSEKWLKDSK